LDVEQVFRNEIRFILGFYKSVCKENDEGQNRNPPQIFLCSYLPNTNFLLNLLVRSEDDAPFFANFLMGTQNVFHLSVLT
jgi:hypothetical protein